MKISKLITLLGERQREHSDLCVHVRSYDHGERWISDVADAEVRQDGKYKWMVIEPSVLRTLAPSEEHMRNVTGELAKVCEMLVGVLDEYSFDRNPYTESSLMLVTRRVREVLKRVHRPNVRLKRLRNACYRLFDAQFWLWDLMHGDATNDQYQTELFAARDYLRRILDWMDEEMNSTKTGI